MLYQIQAWPPPMDLRELLGPLKLPLQPLVFFFCQTHMNPIKEMIKLWMLLLWRFCTLEVLLHDGDTTWKHMECQWSHKDYVS